MGRPTCNLVHFGRSLWRPASRTGAWSPKSIWGMPKMPPMPRNPPHFLFLHIKSYKKSSNRIYIYTIYIHLFKLTVGCKLHGGRATPLVSEAQRSRVSVRARRPSVLVEPPKAAPASRSCQRHWAVVDASYGGRGALQHPGSRVRVWWDYFGMMLLGYDLVVIPLRVFDFGKPAAWSKARAMKRGCELHVNCRFSPEICVNDARSGFLA